MIPSTEDGLLLSRVFTTPDGKRCSSIDRMLAARQRRQDINRRRGWTEVMNRYAEKANVVVVDDDDIVVARIPRHSQMNGYFLAIQIMME
jgi:hypothetical protein